jgi:hypothetical protein
MMLLTIHLMNILAQLVQKKEEKQLSLLMLIQKNKKESCFHFQL